MEQVERCWETFEVLHVLSFRKSGTSIIRDALLLFDWESLGEKYELIEKEGILHLRHFHLFRLFHLNCSCDVVCFSFISPYLTFIFL